jgi:hypothetical protein
VSDDQLEDRLDDALSIFREWHHLGTVRGYLKYQMQAQDITNEYLTLPENVQEVTRLLNYDTSYGAALFSPIPYAKYTYMYNYNFGGGAGQIYGYSVALSNLEQLDEQLGQKMDFQYNRYNNQLFIETDWVDFQAGNYLVMEAYFTQDVEGMYGDIWLQRYFTALVKKQWGNNLGKYSNIQLLNGITFNGEQIMAQAEADIEKLTEDLEKKFTLPAIGLIY